MSLEKTLLDLEAQFWTGDVEFYRRNLAEDVVFVTPMPNGILNRQQAIAAVESTPRWHKVDFGRSRLMSITDNAAVLSYGVSALRKGEDVAYAALISSVYVRRNGAWLLAMHQQTPLSESLAHSVQQQGADPDGVARM